MSNLNLKKRREVLGLSLSGMAAALGVGKSTYDNWERGRANPSRSARAKLIADLARLEGTENSLLVGLPPEKARILEGMAAREGRSPEEMAAELLKNMLRLLVFLAIATVAILLMLGTDLPEPSSSTEDSTHWLFVDHREP